MKKIFLIFLILALASPIYAASTLPDKIQSFYDALEGFSANFTQVLSHKESNSRETRKGKLDFKKPFYIKWQTEKPNEESIIVNPKEIWNYLPDEEIAYKYAPEALNDSKNIIQVLTGQASLKREFEVKEVGRENALVKLSLLPHEPSAQLVEAILWVNPDSGQIARATIIDFYGNANDVTLKDFKPAPNLKNSLFEFHPPKGIEIEDRSKDAGESQLFK